MSVVLQNEFYHCCFEQHDPALNGNYNDVKQPKGASLHYRIGLDYVYLNTQRRVVGVILTLLHVL